MQWALDIPNLRSTTKAARDEWTSISKEEAENRRVSRVMNFLETLARTFAFAGEEKAVVMILQDDEYEIPKTEAPKNFCSPSWLQGAAREVFQQLAYLDADPAVEYWYDAKSGRQGFQIIISW